MSSNERYLEAFKTYYTLKYDYERKLQKMKRRIFNDTDTTKKDKRAQLAKLQIKCINCKRTGGTIFAQDGKNLRATCGIISDPCQLNIDITRGGYQNAFKLLQVSQSNTEEKKTDIIKSKLDLLFNYSTETETAEHFEEILNDYNDNEESVKIIQSAIDDIAYNPEQKQRLDDKKLELFNLTAEIKKKTQHYKKKKDPTIIAQITETTINEITPIANEIRTLSYSNNRVSYDSDDDTYHLIQLPFRDTEIDIDFNEPPIVSSFVVGIKKKAPKTIKNVTTAPE